MTQELADLAAVEFCYLSTVGRVTGRTHTIEIWFALADRTLYLLAGGGLQADWVKNAQRQPAVSVRIQERSFHGRARLVEAAAEDAQARLLVVSKYQQLGNDDLDEWGRTALAVAIDVED